VDARVERVVFVSTGVRWMFGFMRACAEMMEVRVRGGAVAGLAILRGRRTGGVREME
jgi:hypothetical protein